MAIEPLIEIANSFVPTKPGIEALSQRGWVLRHDQACRQKGPGQKTKGSQKTGRGRRQTEADQDK